MVDLDLGPTTAASRAAIRELQAKISRDLHALVAATHKSPLQLLQAMEPDFLIERIAGADRIERRS